MKIKNFRRILLSLLLLLTTLVSMAFPVRADQESEIDEQEVYKAQIIERANTLYRQLAASHDTFNGYITYTQSTKGSYESSLRQANLYNAYKDDMISYTEAFVDIFVSFLKADVQSMGETVANKLADEATKGVLPKVTIDEFIYAQAWEGSKTVSINSLWDFKDIYEGSAEGFTSYDDAAQFIMTVQGNKLGMAALSMGKDLYMDQLNESPWSFLGGIAKDLLVSQVLGYLPDVNWFFAYGGDYAYSTLLDGIITLATESDNPFIAQWKDDIENINQETVWLLRMDESDPALYPEHTVYFDPNGGSVSRASITVHETLPYGSMPVPYLFGYTFNGWFDAREGGHRYTGSSRYELQTDQQLYAHWSHTILDQGACGDNLTWILYGNGILEISGNGAITEAPWREEWPECIGKVIIADGVTSVCGSAFKDLPYLEEVILPGTLDSIGSYAFAGCTGIRELTIPSRTTSIGACAFRDCTGMEKLVLPETAQYDDYAFYGCTGLKEITMPVDLFSYHLFSDDITHVETVRYLKGASGQMPDWRNESYNVGYYGRRVEYNSRGSLRHLYFDEGIVHIGNYAYCGGGYVFNDIHLPSTLESIGYSAFAGMESLTSIEIPEGVTTIGSNAFAGSGLTEVTIPGSVTQIPTECFKDCAALEEVYLPEGLTSIGGNAFENCTALTGLPFIPDNASVEILGGAFRGCTGIRELTIPSTVTSIGAGAFRDCTGMEKLVLPETAQYDDDVFYGCTGLKEITMPVDLFSYHLFSDDITHVETVRYLKGASGQMPDWRNESYNVGYYGRRVEYNSRGSLRHLYFDEGIVHIGNYAYCGGGYVFNDIRLPSTLESIGYSAFAGMGSLTSIEIPEGVATIGSNAFAGSGLTEVTIPGSVTQIPTECFKDCAALEEVYLPEGLTSIGGNAFENCTALTGLPFIPDNASVEILGGAFRGCTGIRELTIPSTITSIGAGAFRDCTGMEKLVLPETAQYDDDVFYGCTGLKEITMPVDLFSYHLFSDDITHVETVRYLKGASGQMPDWRNESYNVGYYGRRVEYNSRGSLRHLYFDEGIVHIGNYAYCGGGYVFNDIRLPSTLESIGYKAFYENTALTSIEIPDNVSLINDDAFTGCGENFTIFGYTGSSAESYANKWKIRFVALDVEWEAEMKLPAGLKTIEEEAFVNDAFHSVEIPDGVQTIGRRAFAGCENLERIIIPASVKTIDPDAFDGIDYLIIYCSAGSKAHEFAQEHGYLTVGE